MKIISRKRTYRIRRRIGGILLTIGLVCFIGSAGRYDLDTALSASYLAYMVLFSLSLSGIGAMLINWGWIYE